MFFLTNLVDVEKYTFDTHNLTKKWPNNTSNLEDDPYESLVFAYNKKMDQLVVANNIITCEVEDPSSPPWPEVTMMDWDEVTTDLEETMSVSTPSSTISSNEMN